MLLSFHDQFQKHFDLVVRWYLWDIVRLDGRLNEDNAKRMEYQ